MTEQRKEGWICPACGLARGPSLHDPCIENLPGVDFACCGHGQHSGYISFEDGTVIRFIPVCVETWCGTKLKDRVEICSPAILDDFCEFAQRKNADK